MLQPDITTHSTTEAVRTTLYLTQTNKGWLEAQPRGQRAKLVNTAIAQLKDEYEMAAKKEALMATLANLPSYPTHGVSPQTVLAEARERHTNR